MEAAPLWRVSQQLLLTTAPVVAVGDATVELSRIPAHQDLPDHQEHQVTQELTVNLDRLEEVEAQVLLEEMAATTPRRASLAPPEKPVHQVLTVQLDRPDQTDKVAHLVRPVRSRHPESLDHQETPDSLVPQVVLERQEHRAKAGNADRVSLDRPESSEAQVHLETPEPTVRPAALALMVSLVPREPMETPDRAVATANLEPTEALAPPARTLPTAPVHRGVAECLPKILLSMAERRVVTEDVASDLALSRRRGFSMLDPHSPVFHSKIKILRPNTCRFEAVGSQDSVNGSVIKNAPQRLCSEFTSTTSVHCSNGVCLGQQKLARKTTFIFEYKHIYKHTSG